MIFFKILERRKRRNGFWGAECNFKIWNCTLICTKTVEIVTVLEQSWFASYQQVTGKLNDLEQMICLRSDEMSVWAGLA